MTIIDKRVFQLDIYSNNNKISNKINGGHLGKNNLVFYDRKDILKLHCDYLFDIKEYTNQVSKLTPLTFLDKNEVVEKVVPLDDSWWGAFVKDKEANKIKNDKIMYISPAGEGYLSNEVVPAIEGSVPENIYMEHAKHDLESFRHLHKKYFDGTHDKFLKNFLNEANKTSASKIYDLMKGMSAKNEIFLSKGKEDLTLEDMKNIIDFEYARKPRGEDFEFYRSLSNLMAITGVYELLELCKKYCSGEGKKSEKQENEQNKESEKE